MDTSSVLLSTSPRMVTVETSSRHFYKFIPTAFSIKSKVSYFYFNAIAFLFIIARIDMMPAPPV